MTRGLKLINLRKATNAGLPRHPFSRTGIIALSIAAMSAIIISIITFSSFRKSESYIGLASYYGRYFQGDSTASGERYDTEKLTAASKTLPLGTMINVTNLENNLSVIVRVNDRGPYVRGRILDLSLAAAKKLAMIKKGVVKVRIEIIK